MCEALEMDEIRKVSVCVMSSDSEDVLSRCSLNAGERGGVRVITAFEYLLYPQKGRLHLYGWYVHGSPGLWVI